MNPLALFFGAFGLMVLYLVYIAKKAGPRTVTDLDIQRGRTLVRISSDDSGAGWDKLGSKTTANGVHLRFDHDDDPQAEAILLAPADERSDSGNGYANRKTVDLTDTFQTHHVHTSGYVFQIRMRGTGGVIGRQVRLQMHVTTDGRPARGQIENDDDTRAAVGDWIEVEFAEIVEVRR